MLTALTVDALPMLSGRLGLERTALASGEPWRLLTGHLVHEVPRVALIDLTLLGLLGGWIEGRGRGLLGAVLIASALTASGAFWFATTYARYVGSSGLTSGLVAAAIVLVHRDGKRGLALCAGVLFGAKLMLELGGQWPATLAGLPEGYQVASAAHLGGAFGGGLMALCWRSTQDDRALVRD